MSIKLKKWFTGTGECLAIKKPGNWVVSAVIPNEGPNRSYYGKRVLWYVKKEGAINNVEIIPSGTDITPDILAKENYSHYTDAIVISADLLRSVKKLCLPYDLDRIYPVVNETADEVEVDTELVFPNVEELSISRNHYYYCMHQCLSYYKRMFPSMSVINMDSTVTEVNVARYREDDFMPDVIFYGKNVVELTNYRLTPVMYCCFPEYAFSEGKKRLSFDVYLSILGGFLLRPDLYNEAQAETHRAMLKKKASALVCHAARKQRYEFVRAYFQGGFKLTVKGYEELLDMVRDDVEMHALVLESFHRTCDVTKLQEQREAHAKKLLENPDMVENYRGYFKWTNESDETVIIDKVVTITDRVLYIPERIGKRRVVGLNKGACASLDVEKIVLPTGIRSIGYQCFYDSDVKDVLLPEGLVTIEGMAFAGCRNLQSITIPKTVQCVEPGMFRYCTKLKEVVLEGDLITLRHEAFEGCCALERIVVKGCIIFVERDVFANCTKLFEVNFGDGDESVCCGFDTDALEKSYIMEFVFKEGTKKVAEGMFADSKLERVTFVPTITRINELAFYGTAKLTDVQIPDSVRVIGSGAFCSSAVSRITSVAGIVGDRAFANNKNLLEVSLPNVAHLERGLFEGCASLENAYLPSVICVKMGVFAGCESLKTITLGDLAEVDNNVFGSCTSLETIYTTGDPKKVREVLEEANHWMFDTPNRCGKYVVVKSISERSGT